MLTLKDYVNWGLTHCDKVESAEGVPLVMENCKQSKKMKELEVYGNSIQNGTPSPEAPVEVESVGEKCTKNLFDVEQFEAELQHGYVLNDAGEKTSDKISTYSTYKIPIYVGQPIHIYGWFQRYYVYDANDVFVKRSGNYINSIMNSTYTPTEDGYIRLQIQNANYNANKGKEHIELGDVHTEYEPYGKYKIPVTVRGKNLYDAKSYPMTVGYYVNGQTGVIPANDSYAATLSYIPCVNLQRKQITINHTGGSNPGIAYYDENKAYISGNKNNSSTKITSIVPDNAYYYRFCIRAEYVDVAQVELGEVPTDFEPYTEPQTTNIYLNEPLRKIGDYADVLDFKNKKVMRNIREVVFSGGELVYTWSIINGKVYGTDKLYTDANLSYFAYDNDTHPRSTHFVTEANKASDVLNINEWTVLPSYRIGFVFSDDVSRDDANSWMQSQYDAGTPVKCYYALSASVSEPIECELPKLTAKTSIVEIDTTLLPSNIKGKYIKK